ncbi:DUF4890 domain-containing protein [Rufibacter psychrotolerans]|uniref:DUF4890 domain-containing protein n=1 Tax=Rufibacter psychrotolerans TaxID=2812556 RepID=UPI001967E0C2|nr:DUF4890 domain-containing protein [Rufibacter sp. SYSU D00308]
MKRILFLLALAFTTFAGHAQSGSLTPEARAQSMTTSMAQHLRLNPAQTAKVKEINLASVQQLEKAKKDFRNDPRQLKATMDLIGATRLEALKSVLSVTQFQQYQQQRERKLGIPSQAGTTGGVPQEYSN